MFFAPIVHSSYWNCISYFLLQNFKLSGKNFNFVNLLNKFVRASITKTFLLCQPKIYIITGKHKWGKIKKILKQFCFDKTDIKLLENCLFIFISITDYYYQNKSCH